MAVVRAVVIIPAWPPPKVELHLFLAALGEIVTPLAETPTAASQHLNEVHVAFSVDGPADAETEALMTAAVRTAMARVHPGPTTVQVVVAPDARPGAIDLRPKRSTISPR